MNKNRCNKTRLIPDQERNIHRDYIAHCFRWDHVCRYLNHCKDKGAELNLLDVGCGEGHLNFAIWGNKLRLKKYVGIDLHELAVDKILKKPQPRRWPSEYWVGDFINEKHVDNLLNATSESFDLAICFEVLEHLPDRSSAESMLINIAVALKPGGIAMVSTPTRFKDSDPVTCKNHLFEYTQEEFYSEMDTQFKNLKVYGTMMHTRKFYKHIKNYSNDHSLEYIVEQLKLYFSSDMISVILAPIYPEFSRSQLIIGEKR